MIRNYIFVLMLMTVAWKSVAAQQTIPSSEKEASLRLAERQPIRASSAVVDIHTHFFIKGKHDPELLDRYVEMMDRNNIAVCVSLDGQLMKRLDEHEQFLWSKYRDRFVLFANIDFQGTGTIDQPASLACNQPNFVRNVVEQLRLEVGAGRISGLKLFKDFGLRWPDVDGQFLKIDDPRFSPIWEACGQLRIPVIMHTADPSAFFRTADEHNERIIELRAHPEWSFADSKFPKRESLLAARNRIIEQNPSTLFIAAHLANDGEDLRELAGWLEKYPNLYVEIASRINELGRQPYSASQFFEEFQDRILFGTDGPFPEERLKIYWRFLETRDEYFHYSEKSPPPQGDWRIYGLGLSQGVLDKIYHANAMKIIPGVRERVLKFRAKP